MTHTSASDDSLPTTKSSNLEYGFVRASLSPLFTVSIEIYATVFFSLSLAN